MAGLDRVPGFVLRLRDLTVSERSIGKGGTMGGGGSWIIARTAVRLAVPVLSSGSLLTLIRSERPKPSTRLADMTGPTGEGLTAGVISRSQDIRRCENCGKDRVAPQWHWLA